MLALSILRTLGLRVFSRFAGLINSVIPSAPMPTYFCQRGGELTNLFPCLGTAHLASPRLLFVKLAALSSTSYATVTKLCRESPPLFATSEFVSPSLLPSSLSVLFHPPHQINVDTWLISGVGGRPAAIHGVSAKSEKDSEKWRP